MQRPISSSWGAIQSQGVRARARRDSLALLMTLLASVLLSGFVIQKFGHQIITSPDFGLQFRRERIRDMVKAVPNMIHSSQGSRLFFVVGTSEIESGFDPISFDREYASLSGQPSVSWNLGLRGRGTELDDMQSAIIHRVAQERRPSLIFNQISLSRTTSRLVDQELEADVTTDFAIYFDRLFHEQYGFRRISEPGLGTQLQMWTMDLFGVDTTFAINFYGLKSTLQEAFMPEAKMGSVFPWRDLDLHVRPAFEVASRGFFNWSLPDSSAAYQRHIENQNNVFARRRIRRFFVNCCFGGQVEISQSALERQIEKGKTWSQILGVPVVHVLLPVRREGYEGLPVQSLNQELKKSWRADWGELLDLTEDKELGRTDNFLDFVHFRPSGQQILARRLAVRAHELTQGGR